jgi:hypothetical protein
MDSQFESTTWWERTAIQVFSEYWEHVLFANSIPEGGPEELLNDIDPLMLAVESDSSDHKDAWIERLVLQRFNAPRRDLLERAKIGLIRRMAEHTFNHAWSSSIPDVDLEWNSPEGEREFVVLTKSASRTHSPQFRRRLARIKRAAPTNTHNDPYRIVLAVCNGPDVDADNEYGHTYGGDALWCWLTGETNVLPRLVRAMGLASSTHIQSQKLVLRRAIAQLQHDLDDPQIVEQYPWLTHFTNEPDLPPLTPDPPVTVTGPAA